MTKTGPDLSESSIVQRFDRSSPDALLKSIAKELVRLGQANVLLEARLAAMESLQAIADRIAAGEEGDVASHYPSHVSIDAANSYLGALGFYEVEHDHNGVPYRWSGPERQFSFQIFVDRRESARFTLKFGQIYANAPLEGLLCFADGERVELTVKRVAAGHEAKGLLPLRKDSGGSVLTFLCPATESPEERGFADRRQLGISFRVLTVEAMEPVAAPVPVVKPPIAEPRATVSVPIPVPLATPPAPVADSAHPAPVQAAVAPVAVAPVAGGGGVTPAAPKPSGPPEGLVVGERSVSALATANVVAAGADKLAASPAKAEGAHDQMGSDVETVKLTVTLPPGADGARARAHLRFHASNRQVGKITVE